MGSWTMTIKGTGPHHNEDNDGDANVIANVTVEELIAAGHALTEATFAVEGGEPDDLLVFADDAEAGDTDEDTSDEDAAVDDDDDDDDDKG